MQLVEDTPTRAPDSPEVLERFHAHLELAEIIARKISREISRGVDLDDLLSAGREGLLKAARRYDPSHAASFATYATLRIRGEILDCVRRMGALPRRTYARLAALEAAAAVNEGGATEAFAGPNAPGGGEAERAVRSHVFAMVTAAALRLASEAARDELVEQLDPEGQCERAELMALVGVELQRLPKDQQEIVKRYNFEGETFDEIASDLQMSKPWANRLYRRALKQLNERLIHHRDPLG